MGDDLSRRGAAFARPDGQVTEAGLLRRRHDVALPAVPFFSLFAMVRGVKVGDMTAPMVEQAVEIVQAN